MRKVTRVKSPVRPFPCSRANWKQETPLNSSRLLGNGAAATRISKPEPMCDLAKFNQRYLPAPKMPASHRRCRCVHGLRCGFSSAIPTLMSRFVSFRPLHSFAAARYELKQLCSNNTLDIIFDLREPKLRALGKAAH